MADFNAAQFLSGNITATEVEKLKKKELILVAKELDANLQVEGIPKADVKYTVCVILLVQFGIIRCTFHLIPTTRYGKYGSRGI